MTMESEGLGRREKRNEEEPLEEGRGAQMKHYDQVESREVV